MKKKAIAPLISTVVLILFAAGLGIVVMNWGSSSGYAMETEGSCDKASVNIIEINNKKDVCFKNNMIYLTLENDGETKMDGLRLSFIGDEIYQKDSSSRLFVGEIKKIQETYIDVGPLVKLQISPIIGATVCVKQSTSIENISPC